MKNGRAVAVGQRLRSERLFWIIQELALFAESREIAGNRERGLGIILANTGVKELFPINFCGFNFRF